MTTTQLSQRPLRSFVIRAGRMTPRQSHAHQALWPTYGIDYAQSQLDFAHIFNRCAPVVLEIGFGMGESLISLAEAHPDVDFLGIEVHPPGVGACLANADERKLPNIRVIMHDAVEVLAHQIPSQSLSQVQVLFPDPWPKKRHHKRRLIQASFIQLLAKTIIPGGHIKIATDWQPYAEHIVAIMDKQSYFMQAIEQPQLVPQSRLADTKFERRGKQLGHGIWDGVYFRTRDKV